MFDKIGADRLGIRFTVLIQLAFLLVTSGFGDDTVQAPPSSLAYAFGTAVYSQGVGITMNRPTVGGGANGLTYELVSGTLPSGVSLSLVTGNIYGTPADTGHFIPLIRVSNLAGSAETTLDLRVKNPTPVISYAPGSFVYPLGSAIATLAPANSGGIVRVWSIAPDLTANTGLLFNSTTGKITGTPTRISVDTAYTITAQGVGELAVHSIPLIVRITSVAPTVGYSNSPYSFPVNSEITPMTKTGATGIITSYSITPALPAGLRFNTTTGSIVGTPTVAAAAANYVITATGPGGLGKDTVNIATTAAAPTVNYTNLPRFFSIGEAMADWSKTNSTGVITRYSIAPPLPPGMMFNTTTGRLSGTPTVLSANQNYRITAHGPGGTGFDDIEFSVDENPPAIAFASDSVLFIRGVEITPLRPDNWGGPVLGWSISPGSNGMSLTANTGLLFSTTTGKILGTPVYPGLPMAYTITAFGWVGSQSQATIVIGTTAPLTKAAFEVPGAPTTVKNSRAINGRSGSAGKYTLRVVVPKKIQE
jgi:hypothetical protein